MVCWACGVRAVPFRGPEPIAFYRCGKCGLVFQPFRTSVETAQTHDEDYFATYAQGRPYVRDLRSRELESERRAEFVARFVPDGRLLEVGSAGGFFLAAAQKRGFETLGVEPEAAMARAASEAFGVHVLTTTIEHAVLPKRAFAGACAWHTLEHIVNPAASLARIRAALEPDGYFFAEVPNIDSVRARRERARWRLLDPEHHVAQYGPTSLGVLLERCGFSVLMLETIPWGRYKPLARAALSYAKHALITHRSPFGSHPWRHELLRAVARVSR